jgi:hypothetical protein
MTRALNTTRRPRFSRQERKLIHWTKPMLVLALQDMPELCPPRVRQQSMAHLKAVVERALWNSSDEIAGRMRAAISAARSNV